MPPRRVFEGIGSAPNGSAPEACAPRAVLESRCRRCLSPWLLELVPFHEPQRSGSRTGQLSEAEQIGRVLDQLPEPERRLYLHLYLLEGSDLDSPWLRRAPEEPPLVVSYELVAAEANRRWPLMRPPVQPTGPRPAGWTRWTVGNVISSGRRRITEGMLAAQLWRFR